MSTRVLQAVSSAILGVALAALVGTTTGQVKSTVKAMTLTPTSPASATPRMADLTACTTGVDICAPT